MTKLIKMGRIIERFRESWLTLTDVRKGNNSQKYTMTDGALAAFSVFFTQSASFLAFQRDMEQKVENENINVLKNQGYHLEHNFGHGALYLANTLFTLNLLAFLVHTTLHIANYEYRRLRETLAVRRTFFHDFRALTRYLLFDNWQHLFDFMIDGLEIQHSPLNFSFGIAE